VSGRDPWGDAPAPKATGRVSEANCEAATRPRATKPSGARAERVVIEALGIFAQGIKNSKMNRHMYVNYTECID